MIDLSIQMPDEAFLSLKQPPREFEDGVGPAQLFEFID